MRRRLRMLGDQLLDPVEGVLEQPARHPRRGAQALDPGPRLAETFAIGHASTGSPAARSITLIDRAAPITTAPEPPGALDVAPLLRIRPVPRRLRLGRAG